MKRALCLVFLADLMFYRMKTPQTEKCSLIGLGTCQSKSTFVVSQPSDLIGCESRFPYMVTRFRNTPKRRFTKQ